MKERYKWPIFGVLFGAFFNFMAAVLVIKQLGELIDTSGIVLNPLAVWERPFGPVVLGIAFFLIGLSRDKLIKKQQDTEKKNVDLQKAMIDQSVQLSAELNSVMQELNNYTNQLDSIVGNIDAGLCLLNEDYTIEEGFNNSFIEIFGSKEYLGDSIFNTAFSMLNDSVKKETTDFIDQCFSNITASDSILLDANPLAEFDYLHLDQGSGTPKTITSKVVRIKGSGNKAEKILFIFNDITADRDLKKSIKQKEEEYNKRYSIMTALFDNDKNVSKRFIADLAEDMKTLSVRLKDVIQNEKNPELITDLIGIIHSIKGDAFSLGFKSLAGIAGNFEDYFTANRTKVIDLEKNLEIIGFYEKLNNEKREFDKTIDILTDFLVVHTRKSIGKESDSNEIDISGSVERHQQYESISLSLLRKQLELVNDTSASETDKKSIFKLNTSVENISAKKYKLLKELLLHLVKNSIAHGIELPQDRLAVGKPENGNITLDIVEDNNNIILKYSDDGHGFDVDKIKTQAVENGMVSESQILNMSKIDIIKIAFSNGFSTSDFKDMVSGVGVGMSVVKKNIYKELKGTLSLKNNPGNGIKINISIPK